MQDIRFVQRFNNFKRALGVLSEGVAVFEDNCGAGNNVIDLMKQGVIQGFEFVHELSWKTMKDYEEYQGYTNIHGSRDAVRGAFEMGLIQDKAWMKMMVVAIAGSKKTICLSARRSLAAAKLPYKGITGGR